MSSLIEGLLSLVHGDFALVSCFFALVALIFLRAKGLTSEVTWLICLFQFFTSLFMPISGPSSYLPTISEFLGHWEDVNDALGVGHELVLPEGINRDGLDILQQTLEGQRDAVTDAAVDRSLARAELTGLITALQGRMVEFNARIRGDLPGKAIALSLPAAFALGDAENLVRDGLRKIARLWGKVNALSPAPAGVTLPLTLGGGYTLMQLSVAREALRVAYRALSDAEVDLDVARGERNETQVAIYPILKGYRLKVTGFLKDHPALIATLPILTPPEGHTPDPVVATGTWEGGSANHAVLTWSESDDSDLREYQVRGVPGEDYETDDEVVLATVPAGGARSLETAFGLGSSGMTSGFKVYVVLHTGRERGSEPVFVTHET